jgi:hypothetical protein
VFYLANFLQLQKRVQDFITDTSSATLQTIKNEINRTINEVLERELWPFSMRTTTFSTTSGTAGYYFPADFGKMVSLTQRTTPMQLQRIWIGDFERIMPDPTLSSGVPLYYMELLNERVLAQPTAAGVITLASNSNSDLTQYASIWGTTGGIDRIERVLISGQNFVSSTNSYTKLYAVTLDLSCVGTIAAYQKTVGTNVANLYPGETERAYKKFNLYPTPDATYTMYMTYQAGQTLLINDSDVPIIPSAYHSMLENLVIGKLLLNQGDSKSAAFLKMGNDGLEAMEASESTKWDETPTVQMASYGIPYMASDPLRWY